LGTYQKCARRFFFGRVLGVEEDSSISLTVGSLLHATLEHLGELQRERGGALPDESEIDGAIAAARARVDSAPRPGTLIEIAVAHHLRIMARQYLTLERARETGYRVESTESSAEFEYDGHQYRGRIDRVDHVPGVGAVVIDYKASSGVHKLGKTLGDYLFSEDPSKSSRYLQVPVYCHALFTQAGTMPGFFCYYAFPPGAEPFVAGFCISDIPDQHKQTPLFNKSVKSDFITVTPGNMSDMMTRIAAVTRDVFATREQFQKTENLSECGSCAYKRMCERGDA